MQRTHRRRDDLTWLPRKVRYARPLTSGVVVGSYALASVAAAAVAPPLLLLWKALAIGSVGAYLLGNQAGQRALERRLQRLGRGEMPLGALSEQENGSMVVVQGEIVAEQEQLSGLLHKTPGVYRRMSLHKRSWIHEAAVDFVIVDDDGTQTPVRAAGSHWLHEGREEIPYPKSLFAGEHVPLAVRELVGDRGSTVFATESVLQAGDRVRIVAHKGVIADATGRFVGYRSAPERAVLCSGPNLPLVISKI